MKKHIVGIIIGVVLCVAGGGFYIFVAGKMQEWDTVIAQRGQLVAQVSALVDQQGCYTHPPQGLTGRIIYAVTIDDERYAVMKGVDNKVTLVKITMYNGFGTNLLVTALGDDSQGRPQFKVVE